MDVNELTSMPIMPDPSNAVRDFPDGAHAVFDFSEVLDQCLEGALIAIDAQQTVVGFAGDAEKYTGLSSVDALGKPVGILPSPLRELLQNTFSAGKAHHNAQMLLRPEGAQGVNARVTTAVLRAAGGKPRGAVALIHDLAPIRNLEHRLRRLDRLASLGTLSASVAHEVKNALVAVKTFVDLLRDKNQDAPLADVVNREIGRIDSIVSQLLRFSGRTRSAFEPLRLHEVLEHSLTLLKHQLDANRIHVRRAFEATPDVVQGDAYQLEQAFMNLLLNALEAMPNGGELNLATRLAPAEETETFHAIPPMLTVILEDNGPGIPPENLEKLFEPFFTTKSHGTGLGLPITRRIVQEHQGTIRVESRAGQGTRFILTFPSGARQP
jgi:signal transduction histidine kinase